MARYKFYIVLYCIVLYYYPVCRSSWFKETPDVRRTVNKARLLHFQRLSAHGCGSQQSRFIYRRSAFYIICHKLQQKLPYLDIS